MAKTEEKDQNLEELVASVTQSRGDEELPPEEEESEPAVHRIDVLNLPPRRTIPDRPRTSLIVFILLYTDVPLSIPALF